MIENDQELLARHAREGSEDVFAELVRRHAGLVLSGAPGQAWLLY